MKHIFLIHSHTLYLTSLATIEYLKLKKEDIIFIYSRYYNTILKNDFLTVDMSEEAENCFHAVLSFSRRNYLINHKLKNNIIRKVDTFIDKNVTDVFNVYVPHLQSFISQIFATHERCVECNFVQEGGRVMSEFVVNKNWLPFQWYNFLFLRKEKRIWKSICWFPMESVHFTKPIRVYAIDKKFFGEWNGEIHVIKWPELQIPYTIESQCPIFVYEGAVELGQVEKHIYMNAVKRQIEKYHQKNNYVKFHPMQTIEAKKTIKNFFIQEGVEMMELPMDVPFELLLTSYKNLKLYGFGTSLLFFAKALGHEIVSDEKELLKSHKYRQYYKRILDL